MARQSRNLGVANSLILVRAARQLVTLHGKPEPRRGSQMSELAIIPDGALLVRNGRIVEVGTTRRIERLKAAREAIEVDATGCVVLPAFIDSVAPDVFQGEERRSVIETSAGTVLEGMVRHGTLTVEAQLPASMRILRICASMQGTPANLVLSVVLGQTTSPILLETTKRLRLAHSATVVVGRDGVGTGQMRQFLAGARTLGMHTVVQAVSGSAVAAAFLAFECAPASVRGLDSLPELSIRALARSGMVASCLQARRLIDEGGALSLGTGFSYKGNRNYNMSYTLSRACLESQITYAEALTASTINAAFATGCATVRGSLEPGKWADLVLYDNRNFEEVLRNGAVNQVKRVLRHGATIYRRGRVEVQKW